MHAVAQQLKNKIRVNTFEKGQHNQLIREIFDKLKLTAGVNAGVFNGKWGGSGPVVESVDPATNERIAQIQTVQIAEYILS